MKIVIGIVVVIVLGLGAFTLWNPTPASVSSHISQETELQNTPSEEYVLASGTYIVDAGASIINWAGKKPFINGYVNAGSIGVESGTVSVSDSTYTAEFTIDMNTLSVSGTPTKPGSESALEGHLKGERWFNVAEYPTATFAIDTVVPRDDTNTTSLYDVTGTLTMKGQTGPLTFPARIYTDDAGTLHAQAEFEFDRTKWGITSGSGSFFDNLADNVIDDMVTLSFSLVAEKE